MPLKLAPSSETFELLLEQLREAHAKQCKQLTSEVTRLEGQLLTSEHYESARSPFSSEQAVDVAAFDPPTLAPPTSHKSGAYKSSVTSIEEEKEDIRNCGGSQTSLKLDHELWQPDVSFDPSTEQHPRRGSILSYIPGLFPGVHMGSKRSAEEIRQSEFVCKIKGQPKRISLIISDWKLLWFRTCVGSLVQKPWYESFFGFIIIVSTMVMGAERQYLGIQIAFELEVPGANLNAAETWPGAKDAFEVLDWIVGILFALELLLNVVGVECRKFIKDWWNCLDTVIVLSWVMDKMGSEFLPIDTQLLRLLRLMRLLRLLRLVRAMEGFDSLYLMTQAVKGSLSILSWACCLLFLIQVTIALLISQLLSDSYMGDSTKPVADRTEIYLYFGTFSRSMLSMFEITLANWPPICRLLSENVSEWWSFFCILHKLSIGFAVVGVINGVFMQETFKAAAADDVIMMRQMKKASQVHIDKMEALFKQADHNQDGYLDLQEFAEVINDSFVKIWLGSMGLEVDDAGTLFDLLDDGDGLLNAEELIKGVARLKGTARALDVAKDMKHTSDILDRLERYLNKQGIEDLPAETVTSFQKRRHSVIAKHHEPANHSTGCKAENASFDQLASPSELPNADDSQDNKVTM